MNPLFDRLRQAGIGCEISGMWIGIGGYADDIILLALNRLAAQRMLKICEEFADEYNIKFSTDEDPSKSKSKAIYMVGRKGLSLEKPIPLMLCGKPLPWVERADHLGHTLSSDGTMTQDIKEKRAQFINSAVKVRETFSYSYPEQVIEAVDKYCCSFYSSNLWDLNSPEAETVFASWRTNLKLAWDCPRATRGYLVQEVLSGGQVPVRTRMLLKFKGFFDSLMISPSKEARMMVRMVAGNVMSNTGSNIRLLQDETGLDPCRVMKHELKEVLLRKGIIEVPKLDLWRPNYLRKLLQKRREHYYSADVSLQKEVQSLIDSLCIN